VNAALKVRGDESVADGMDHVFMQRLQAEQLAALVAQLHAGLAAAWQQRTGEVRHSQIGAEVDDDYNLEGLKIAAGGKTEKDGMRSK